mmetsp:Transcript_24518/g.48079  ORF Transcript_24518/g.48079 Transcript_24518/m.48079 type:complete len:218 (-) Transcript_24518:238-891(-)
MLFLVRFSGELSGNQQLILSRNELSGRNQSVQVPNGKVRPPLSGCLSVRLHAVSDRFRLGIMELRVDSLDLPQHSLGRMVELRQQLHKPLQRVIDVVRIAVLKERRHRVPDARIRGLEHLEVPARPDMLHQMGNSVHSGIICFVLEVQRAVHVHVSTHVQDHAHHGSGGLLQADGQTLYAIVQDESVTVETDVQRLLRHQERRPRIPSPLSKGGKGG